jgi:FAD/FMN-containing dehydrogenase
MQTPALAPNGDQLSWLANRLGPKGLTCDPQIMQPWLTDWRGTYTGSAAGLLSPASLEQVVDIVQYAAQKKLALVPQGGNSGMAAGATPSADGTQLLLSLRRMNALRSIDSAAQQCVAEAGVILSNLHDATNARGLRFPLTLGGKGSATIGGLVSTNAGGTQVIRHGTMRALTLGIEAVLPDGSVFNSLAALKKDNRGYDLTQLLVGAEGTLGIITAATLKLVPQFAQRSVAWAAVSSTHKALELLHHMQAKMPTALEGFEIVPHSALQAVLHHIPDARAPISSGSAWHVLIEVVADDSAAPLEAELLDALSGAMERGLIDDAVIAKHESEAEAFWNIRDGISEAERVQGPSTQHDVSVPSTLMPDYIDAVAQDLGLSYAGVRVMAFGHLGDGNVHHHIRPPAGVDQHQWLADHGDAASAALYQQVMKFGGSISAEHGIGLAKRDDLVRYSDPARISAMRAIKSALDPHGILNPGKLFV